MPEKNNIILFDGQCKLCNAWCNFILHYDKHYIFTLISMQSDNGQSFLIKNKYPTVQFETMLYVENNIIYEKSTAIIKIIKQLPYPIKMLFIIKYIPKFIRDFTYEQIARNRYKIFGKYSACAMTKDEHGKHFP